MIANQIDVCAGQTQAERNEEKKSHLEIKQNDVPLKYLQQYDIPSLPMFNFFFVRFDCVSN